MKRDFKEALEHRRSYYSIGSEAVVSNAEIESILQFALMNTPSAFNSQSTRLVLLLGDNHKKLWTMIKEYLRNIVPAESFSSTESKIDNSFYAGYGTVLFFEDQDVVDKLQKSFPLYAANFPVWSEQTSAMHQLAIWTMLEDAGFGASLQHYNGLIDGDIHSQWNIPQQWKLIAEMPFGNPLTEPSAKSYEPINDRMKVFI